MLNKVRPVDSAMLMIVLLESLNYSKLTKGSYMLTLISIMEMEWKRLSI